MPAPRRDDARGRPRVDPSGPPDDPRVRAPARDGTAVAETSEGTPRRRLGAALVLGAGAASAWVGAVAVNRALRAVDGPSMLPLVTADDLLVTAPAGLVRPRRGDLVVLAAGTVGPGPAVKRLVSGPGDRVVMLDGHLHTDGSWWDLPAATLVDEDHAWDPAPDEVVVLGDNRAHSTDSRAVGPVPVVAVARTVLARARPWRDLRGGMRRLPGPRRRDAVRVVVLDRDDRTLLFRVSDVDGVRPDWWETPGGGLHPAEDHRRAAERELGEEVGATDVEVHDLGHVAERDSTLWGVHLHRVEATWAARVPDPDVSTAGWTASEHLDHQGWHWFTREELVALEAVTHPVEVVALYDRAIATVPPVEPPVEPPETPRAAGSPG